MTEENEDIFDDLDTAGEETEKARLDEDVARDEDPRGMEKVELDLDDAPFLDDAGDEDEDEDDRDTRESEEAQPEEFRDEDAAGKPLWIQALGAGITLVCTGLIIGLIIWRNQAPQLPGTLPGAESDGSAAAAQPLSLSFEPFMVEYVQEGNVRFLNLEFTVSGPPSTALRSEMQSDMLMLRDAVYTMLEIKELVFLDDPAHAENLKEELLDTLNRNLEQGQLDRLYIVEYMVL